MENQINSFDKQCELSEIKLQKKQWKIMWMFWFRGYKKYWNTIVALKQLSLGAAVLSSKLPFKIYTNQ